jgi:hypothetical protein
MRIVELKSLKWAVYDSNGKVIIITSNKSVAVGELKRTSSVDVEQA